MATIEAHLSGASTRRAPWKVRAHGRLEPLAENVWSTWFALPADVRRRRMVLARRRDGDLVLHDVAALDAASMRTIESIGEPRYLVVPGAGSSPDASAFVQRYPRLQVFAPRGARDAVSRRMKVDGIFEDFPVDGDVQLRMLGGLGDAEGTMQVSSRDGTTVVMNEIVAYLAERRDTLGARLATLFRSARRPRLFFLRDKEKVRRDLRRLAELPDLVRVVAANTQVASGPEAARVLEQAASSI